MTVGEFKQWLIDNEIPDGTDLRIMDDGYPSSTTSVSRIEDDFDGLPVVAFL